MKLHSFLTKSGSTAAANALSSSTPRGPAKCLSFWSAAFLGLIASASAAVIDISGDINIDSTVGGGNSGRMIGATSTFWNSGGFSVPVDTNGYTLGLDNGNGNNHTVTGTISGTGSIAVRSGPHWSGTWNVPYTIGGSDDNTYSGTTLIQKGSALLNKTVGVDALLGSITVGSASESARLTWAANDQINDSATITVLLPTVSGGAVPDAELNYLDLAGFSESFDSLTLADGGTKTQVRTGAGGVLTLNELTVNSVPMDPGTYTSSNSSFVFGSGSVVVIPEPTAAVLGSLGLLALLRRRRDS